MALGDPVWIWTRRAGAELDGDGRFVSPDRNRWSGICVAGLQVADSVGSCGTAHLHESVVGVVFGLEERRRRMVSLRAPNYHDPSCDIGHRLFHTVANDSWYFSNIF